MESNLYDLANLVCDPTVGPRDIGSIKLGLESEQVQDTTNGDQYAYIYNILLITSKYICEILFGFQDLSLLSLDQFNKLKSYFVALEYTIDVTANKTTSTPWELVKDTPLNSIEIAFRKLVPGVDYFPPPTAN